MVDAPSKPERTLKEKLSDSTAAITDEAVAAVLLVKNENGSLSVQSPVMSPWLKLGMLGEAVVATGLQVDSAIVQQIGKSLVSLALKRGTRQAPPPAVAQPKPPAGED